MDPVRCVTGAGDRGKDEGGGAEEFHISLLSYLNISVRETTNSIIELKTDIYNPTESVGLFRNAGSVSSLSPLPGDEVDVMSKSRVVFGKLLGRRVLPRVLRFGRVSVHHAAEIQENAQKQGEGCGPRLQYHNHLLEKKKYHRSTHFIRSLVLSGS